MTSFSAVQRMLLSIDAPSTMFAAATSRSADSSTTAGGFPGPAAMTFFVYQVTGAKLLERTMMRRPGYPEYAARTSMFVPLPPKRS